ncbi:hypothetical protein CONCODRAFT_19550 [Conidiobolus coronatus NRRL 28638]|uniref:Uncharacterized protein n=1 Tax=Conidiobolus coronatus (strain ATCC 28846 / CBS 209.66 / NRRL 28638) TaxID=796925 RepID=A0A137NY29_CONC2|nr:hypothetical protein CONCODRAFT_19550 [Conidiobolus coronatus NRRL 28638]|eukprot:KXN67499.1 hypothetical protein CONCODRAFT_19550 [Conidiobolus coronatus NRRL 28638]
MADTFAENYKYLVGKTLIEMGREAEVSKTDKHVLERELPHPRRVIKPGSLHTADYNENRLNVTLNDKNTIMFVKNG